MQGGAKSATLCQILKLPYIRLGEDPWIRLRIAANNLGKDASFSHTMIASLSLNASNGWKICLCLWQFGAS